MSCEKGSWTRSNGSQRNNNSAEGDNPRASLVEPALFLQTSAESQVGILSYELGGRQVILTSYRQGGLRLRAFYESGIELFDITYPSISAGQAQAVLENKGWIVCGKHIFDAGLGLLLGVLSFPPNDVFESFNGDVVIERFVDYTPDGLPILEYYLVEFGEEVSLQETYLWTANNFQYAYDPLKGILLFPDAGESRELMTGDIAWSLPPNGVSATLASATLYAGFDVHGSAYIAYRKEVGESKFLAKLQKLSFPEKAPGVPSSASADWDVDLSQYLTTRNGDPLWASEEPQFPFRFAISDQYVWFFQNFLIFSNIYGEGGQPIGEDAPPQPTGQYFDAFRSHLTLSQVKTSDGLRERTFFLPQQNSSSASPSIVVSPRLIAASSPDEDWAIVHLQSTDSSSNSEPDQRSLLAVNQGDRIAVDYLAFPSQEDEYGYRETDVQLLTPTLLPHGELHSACIVGGRVYYSHLEEDETVSVRRLGLQYRCDDKRRYQSDPDPCVPPGNVSLLGDIKLPPSGVAHFNLTFSSCDLATPPRSMGYGWYLDAYKKIIIGDETLEFIDGSGGYEQWELFKGEYIPVHRDNYVKATANLDGTYTLTFPDFSKMEFDADGKLMTWTDRSSNITSYVYEETAPEEAAAARLIEVNDGHGVRTRFEYGSSLLTDRQPVKLIEVERGNTLGEGRETNLAYDGTTKRLTSVTAANGDKTEYKYYPDGRMHKIIVPGDRVAIEYTYDSEGRVETETTFGIMMRTYGYDPEGRSTSLTLTDLEGDSDDRTMTYEYDLLYRLNWSPICRHSE